MTSNGLSPVSRRGTRATSISTPRPPRAAISTADDVKPGRAEVLHRHDVARLEHRQTRFEQQLLQKRIADLDHAAVAGLRIVVRGERRALQAVAAGVRADQQQRVAGPAGSGSRQPRSARTSPTHIALTIGLPA